MSSYLLKFLLILMQIAFGSHIVFAQNSAIKFLKADSLFHNLKGTWTTSNYLEFYDSEDRDTPIAIFQFNSETSYYLFDGFALAGNIYGMYPHGFRFNGSDEYEVRNTFGLGISGMLRWEFVQLFGHNLYWEAGFGLLATNKEFPPLGTRLNFTQRYGFGTNIPINKKIILTLGVRHMHISNGKGFTSENPQYNGNGVIFGVKFKR